MDQSPEASFTKNNRRLQLLFDRKTGGCAVAWHVKKCFVKKVVIAAGYYFSWDWPLVYELRSNSEQTTTNGTDGIDERLYMCQYLLMTLVRRLPSTERGADPARAEARWPTNHQTALWSAINERALRHHRPRDMEEGCAHAHVQLHPTSDLTYV